MNLRDYIKSFKHFLTDKQYEVKNIEEEINLNDAEEILYNYLKEWNFYLNKKNYLKELTCRYSEIFSAFEKDKNDFEDIISKIKDWVNYIEPNEIINYKEYLDLKKELEENPSLTIITDFIFSEKYEALQTEFDWKYPSI